MPADPSAPTPSAPGLVPVWLANLAAFGWRILAIVGVALVIVWVALLLISVTASLVLSVVLAAAAAPLVLRLRARGWPRVRAALAAWALVGIVILAGIAFVVVAFVPAIADLVRALQAGVDALRSGSAGFTIPPELATTADQVSAVVTTFARNTLGDLAGRVSFVATVAILSTFLTFFVLLDADIGWTEVGKTFYHASASYVQATSAAINPNIFFTNSVDQYNCCAIALKIN